MSETDLVVIGGGIGGYVCAIRASQLGLMVVLVEKARLGGECLIAGCIPSKSMISVAKIYDKVRDGARFGIVAEGLRVDFGALQAWKSNVISTLEAGVASLCQGNKVTVIKGDAELVEKDRIVITTSDGQKEELITKNVVIATGSSTISLPGIEFDGEHVIGSREALELKSLPRSILIVGGGYIGMEIASMYQRLGSQISIVELTDRLLSGTEPDLVRYVQRNLTKRGAAIKLSSRVTSVVKTASGVKATVESQGLSETIEAELLLVSVGRRAVTNGLNLERIGVKTDTEGVHNDGQSDDDECARGLRNRGCARATAPGPQGSEGGNRCGRSHSGPIDRRRLEEHPVGYLHRPGDIWCWTDGSAGAGGRIQGQEEQILICSFG